MIPKPVRRVFTGLIFIGCAFFVLDAIRIHSHQAVIAYKRYAKAVDEGDRMAAVKLSVDREEGAKPVFIRKKRIEGLEGERRFPIYYRVKKFEKNENFVNLRVNQVIRMDRYGQKTLLGSVKVVNPQSAVMVKEGSTWKVQSFSDRFYHPGMKEEKKR